MDDARPFIPLEDGQAAWRATRGYVENVAGALALAVEDERAAGWVYNVGDDVAFTEAAWIRRLGAVTGWTGRVVALPKPPGEPPSGKDWRHHLVADTRKIRRALGYTEPVALDEALRRTIAWERARPPDDIDPALFNYAEEEARLAGRA
jgi:nucleoside-diphosphate-sugar epimerase